MDARDKLIAEQRAKIAELEATNTRLTAELATAHRTIGRLEARVLALQALVRQNSSNSNKPPSSDPPGQRGKGRHGQPSGRKRGGQPGHTGHRREYLPPEKVKETHDYFPERCAQCERELPRESCGEPLRHQVVEPKIDVEATDHYCHAVQCACGHVTRAKLPEGVAPGMCGPQLTAIIGLLTGVYHLSRRGAEKLVSELLGVSISLGALSAAEQRVSDALAVPVEEALDHANHARVKHVDATGWRQGGEARTLWTIATAAVTVFVIAVDASRTQLQLFLTTLRGILVSDRASQFTFWAMDKRQICWAHLLRKFLAFAEDERPEVAERGKYLLFWAHALFHAWHQFKDRQRTRAHLQAETMAVRPCIENLLEQLVALDLPGVSGSAADILAHREALWTFLDRSGVEPTNNHSERELRAFVLWRKKSFGSQSERGSTFAARIMTTVHTLRKQGRGVLAFLTEAVSAAFLHQAAPSLLPKPP